MLNIATARANMSSLFIFRFLDSITNVSESKFYNIQQYVNALQPGLYRKKVENSDFLVYFFNKPEDQLSCKRLPDIRA